MAKSIQVEESGPKYRQIYSQLRRALAINEYSPGDMLRTRTRWLNSMEPAGQPSDVPWRNSNWQALSNAEWVRNSCSGAKPARQSSFRLVDSGSRNNGYF